MARQLKDDVGNLTGPFVCLSPFGNVQDVSFICTNNEFVKAMGIHLHEQFDNKNTIFDNKDTSSHHITLYYIISYHIISYHIISYHIIL